MSNFNNDNAINFTHDSKKVRDITNQLNQSADQRSQDRAQTPEPKGRQLFETNTSSINTTGLVSELVNKLTINDQPVERVKVRQDFQNNEPARSGDDDYTQTGTSPFYYESTILTSSNKTPVEHMTDEGVVSSPTNVCSDDGDEPVEGFYENEDYYDESGQAPDELTNLSRQSMVPLHELIAYYQYIQQGSSPIDKVSGTAVSRQSSSASQNTTVTKYSQYNDNSCPDTAASSTGCSNESDLVHYKSHGDPAAVTEKPIQKVKIPDIFVGKSDEISGTFEDRKQPEKQKIDKRRIRANVVLELIKSERDFVKHLKDVVEGYLYPARRHPEIFTGERINTIFSNIEQLYEFQRKFLDDLELCINWDELADSQVGRCFLEYEKGFSVYHYYCNNHPNAISELQDLYTKPRFVKFFEACRLLQNMIDISLDGFLLTPIQKICKYPLQLNELLKNTDASHPDHPFVADALESMRNCANLANERKRRIEALADVMSFQEQFDNWFGPKLSETSSILIHSGEVSKMASHTWSQGIQLHLFDRLLLFSKKDLLKRNILILKGRVCMDNVTEISDADEYKPKKSFKLYCSEQQKWFVFTTKSEKERDEWIRAFERERNLVEADEVEGFRITDREIGIARRALQHRKHNRSARYRHKRPDTAIVDQIDIDGANMIMNRTLSLPSCIHPSHVMNFVEDSKVVSSRKKNTSPISASRTPMASSQFLPQDTEPPQASGGNWFKKMGSRKLTRSQVYNINGQSGLTSNVSKSQTSPPASRPTAISATFSNDTAPTTYDQLEKRHRDHMISEEQARLFRLNNDLPPPPILNRAIPSPTPTAGTVPKLSHAEQQSFKPAYHKLDELEKNCGLATPARPQRLKHKTDKSSCIEHNQSTETNLIRHQQIPCERNSGTTFEGTIVLSTGRIVKVREDAV